MALKVRAPGVFTTVQDLGRTGHQSSGFSPAGAMDYRACMLANFLLGNDENAAVLEMTYQGGTFEALRDMSVAAAGAEMQMHIGGAPVKTGTVTNVLKGETITFGPASKGARTYLAVRKGFDIESVLGSVSTHTRSGIGGYRGRTLAAGDILPTLPERAIYPVNKVTDIEEDDEIRVIPGQQYDRFKKDMDQFYQASYKITKDSDRMGFRLDGPMLEAEGGHDVLSEPTQLGSIQVPKGGQPIILLNDRQTAGGYTRIATVAMADIPKLVQKKQGEEIYFTEIGVEAAREAYMSEIRRIKNGSYLEPDNDFTVHRRRLASKLESHMKR